MRIRNIWMITREYGDIAGAGGVKDVVAQLSRALAKWNGRKVSVVLPWYGFMDSSRLGTELLCDPLRPDALLEFSVAMNYAGVERQEDVTVQTVKDGRVTLYFLKSDRFSEKLDVYTYSAEEERFDPSRRRGHGHFDYFAMNILLQKGALQLMMHLAEIPDVIHCHDGHTAVLPALIAETDWIRGVFRDCGCLMSIHNAGRGYHQEVADIPFAQAITGLPRHVIDRGMLEGNFDPLVSAAGYGIVNTVSENYARELQESGEDERTGWLGHHLLAGGCRIEGVTNGIDPEVFDPRRGKEGGLAASFDPRDDKAMDGKRICRQDLLRQIADFHTGMEQHGTLREERDCPLFTFIGRFTPQKGVDILADAIRQLFYERLDFQCLILGSGQSELEEKIEDLASLPEGHGRICFLKGYDVQLATRIYAGGDFFLIPSRYEPCGLTDFIAQLYANLPVVHAVGGLVKVLDGVTGFSYAHNDPGALARAMSQAAGCYRDSELMRTMQCKAVALIDRQYTWKIVKERYLQLYSKAKERNHI